MTSAPDGRSICSRTVVKCLAAVQWCIGRQVKLASAAYQAIRHIKDTIPMSGQQKMKHDLQPGDLDLA